MLLLIVLLPLSDGSFSQAVNTTSQIKKPLIYQIGNVVHVNADGERPLLRTLDALQEKYGWIVNYEDPPYATDADELENAPSLPSRRHVNARNLTKEGFSVEFTVGPSPDSLPAENSVLTTVVNAYNEGSSVAQFELRNEGDNQNKKQKERHFDVVGVISGEQKGTQNDQPIFDAQITLAKEHRDADTTIALICERVSEQSGIPVTVGATDGKVTETKRVAIGGFAVPARTLLSRALASMGDRLSWRLLYDSSNKSYELSLSGLPQ
jgi:hypothetical protein